MKKNKKTLDKAWFLWYNVGEFLGVTIKKTKGLIMKSIWITLVVVVLLPVVAFLAGGASFTSDDRNFLLHGSTYTTYAATYIICVRVSDGYVWDAIAGSAVDPSTATWANCAIVGTRQTTFDYVKLAVPNLPAVPWDVKIYGSADGTPDSGDTYITGFRVVPPHLYMGYNVPQ